MLQYGARRRCFLSIGIEDYAFRPLKHAEKDAEVLAFKFQTRGSAGLGGQDGLVMLFLRALQATRRLECFDMFQICFNMF
jgi:hypothetical protein